jgi:hypothetical protein
VERKRPAIGGEALRYGGTDAPLAAGYQCQFHTDLPQTRLYFR